VAGGRGSRSRSRPRARAASGVVTFPRSLAGDRLELSRLAPSGRSLVTALLILLAGIGLYAAARTTSAFAVDAIVVAGASPAVTADVRAALAPSLGESLLGIEVDELVRRAEAVPTVARVSLDRGFPHTLRIAVIPEVPVAVLRQGSSSWLAAASGRVVAGLDGGTRRDLPRVWLKRDVDVRVGETLHGLQRVAVASVAPLLRRPLPAPVASVDARRDELTLRLRSGLELRLGDSSDLAVKLEVARRVLPRVVGAGDYLDVSVPSRPVAGESLYSPVEVETSTSTVP